ncbi:MAG: hypothetical protein WBF09_05045 [Candidatus Acidiferrum sp.]
MKTNEERIEILEQQLAEIIKLKGIPGARGPAGPIEAAVANAERVLDEKLASLFDRVDHATKQGHQSHEELSKILRNEMDRFRKDMRQNFSDFEASIQTRVENSIVVLFAEYGVVSSHDNRPIQA